MTRKWINEIKMHVQLYNKRKLCSFVFLCSQVPDQWIYKSTSLYFIWLFYYQFRLQVDLINVLNCCTEDREYMSNSFYIIVYFNNCHNHLFYPQLFNGTTMIFNYCIMKNLLFWSAYFPGNETRNYILLIKSNYKFSWSLVDDC